MIIESILIILGVLTALIGAWNIIIGAYLWGALFFIGGIWSIGLGIFYIIQLKKQKKELAKNTSSSSLSSAKTGSIPTSAPLEEGLLTQDLFATGESVWNNQTNGQISPEQDDALGKAKFTQTTSTLKDLEFFQEPHLSQADDTDSTETVEISIIEESDDSNELILDKEETSLRNSNQSARTKASKNSRYNFTSETVEASIASLHERSKNKIDFSPELGSGDKEDTLYFIDKGIEGFTEPKEKNNESLVLNPTKANNDFNEEITSTSKDNAKPIKASDNIILEKEESPETPESNKKSSIVKTIKPEMIFTADSGENVKVQKDTSPSKNKKEGNPGEFNSFIDKTIDFLKLEDIDFDEADEKTAEFDVDSLMDELFSQENDDNN